MGFLYISFPNVLPCVLAWANVSTGKENNQSGLDQNLPVATVAVVSG